MGKTRRAGGAQEAPAAAMRRTEYQAESLTGKRAQSGRLPGGGPRYTYEVKWKDASDGKKYANTFEPAANLVEWAAEMKKVDDLVAAALEDEFLKPVRAANAAKEVAAKKRAEELAARREKLLRKQRRLNRRSKKNTDAEDSDGDEEKGEEESEDDESGDESEGDVPQGAAQLSAALADNLEQLRQIDAASVQPDATKQTKQAAAITEEGTSPQATAVSRSHKKQGPSRVWLAFDFATNTCMLPHPQDSTRKCGAGPGAGTGTSGHRAHLSKEHNIEWAHILTTGKVKTSVQMIADALNAKVDLSTPSLGDKEKDELHRLTALWVSKCGRPQAIVEDVELRSLLARILALCKARLRYELPCRETLGQHLMLLGHEGKVLGRDFIVRLIKSGVKPTITGDLWSESGMGLFGIYAHGISETWVMEKALIGLVACSAERHTAVNIKKWTEEALKGIGFTSDELLGSS